MDINDFFRGFFGFNHMHTDRFNNPFSHGHHGQWNDEEDFNRSHDNDKVYFDDGFSNVFHQMEDMFNGMFSIHSGFLDFPNLEFQQEQENPRDLMLREPSNGQCEKHWSPESGLINSQDMSDKDLDDKVANGGLSQLQEQRKVTREAPRNWSFRKSVSSKIMRSADGVLEEHRTTTDSSGKTITTIRKAVGDQTYQITTESNKNGLIEKKEDFVNMDENDIPAFEERFGRAKSPNFQNPRAESRNLELVPSAPPGDLKYLSLFKRFFGPGA